MLTIAACTNVELHKEFKTARATVQEERVIAVREELNCTLCSIREMSWMKCGHPGNFPNVSYRIKVNEFASLMRQSSCPCAKGHKPNNVWSDLKHLRAHAHLLVRQILL